MNKQEIAQQVTNNLTNFLTITKKFDEFAFYQSINNGWSAAEHSIHLAKSAKPLNMLFALPNVALKLLLRFRYGKTTRNSRSYDALVERYHTKLSMLQSFPNNPFGAKPSEIPTTKTQTLAKVAEFYQIFQKRLMTLNERDLDNYLIPHPLLGKLTLREMAYFTAYHIKHHTERLSKL